MSTNGSNRLSTITSIARETAGWTSYVGGLYGTFLLVKDSYRYGRKFLEEREEAEREEAAKRAAKAIEAQQPAAQPPQPVVQPQPVQPVAEELQQQIRDLQEQLRLQPVGGRWQTAGRPRKPARKPGRKAARKQPPARTLADGETRPGRRKTRGRRMQMQS